MRMKQRTQEFISSCNFTVSSIGKVSFFTTQSPFKKKIPNSSSSLKTYTKQIKNYKKNNKE